MLTGLFGAQLTPLRAQQTVTVARDGEPFLAAARGTRLGRLAPGVTLAVVSRRDRHTQVTIDGWIFRSSVDTTSRDGKDLVVRRPEENIRAAPNGRLIVRLIEGSLLDEVERRGAWIRVRRTGWVADAGLTAPAAPTATRPGAAPPPVAAPATATPARQAAPAAAQTQTSRTAMALADSTAAAAADPRRAVVRRRMQLYRAPDSQAVGTLEAGVPVRVTARAGDWVRVETQAWVRAQEVRPSDESILTGITAAELRGAPEEFRGKLLRWTIQFLSVQTADELRADFTPGERYVLARGPAPEYAFVYIVIPPVLLAEVERLTPLASVTIVARVVAGRSAYLANPILELVEMQ